MREILFRGMTEQGEWVYGDLIQQHDNCYISPKCEKGNYPMSYGLGSIYASISGLREVKPETVSQYTGLKDKNGNKIFEGDRVCVDTTFQYIGKSEEYRAVGNVIYIDGQFRIDECFSKYTPSIIQGPFNSVKIIGNVWEVGE